MSVEIGSLSYVSTLDNSDFVAKSQQDIKLITTRLQLTGDTSGIEKYEAAFKAASAAEIKIQSELNKILEDAKVKTEELVKTVQKPASKTVFSDSAAEVQAYNDALNGLESGATIVAGLNEQLDALVVKQQLLTEQFTAGAISEVEYNDAMLEIGASQINLVENIKRVNDAYSTNILIQNENIVATEKTTVAVQEEIGVLEELRITLKSLKTEQATASASQLPIINKQIQETEANIKGFSNAGKVGFDALGNEIEQTATKTGKFEAAVARSTSISNIGARVVTQFTRQIVGLGVGFLSLEIGAKAIQSLIEYISNLDIFTGRLDQAKQNLLAFDEVMKNANQSVGPQITTLKLLYDATQNVALSMDKRLEAAQNLREEYPSEFENSTNLSIVNGKLKTSYDELSASIIENAKSIAARGKIAQLESTILDAQFQIDKNNSAKAQELARISGVISSGSVGTGGGGSSTGVVSEALQRQNIIARTNVSNTLPAQTIAIAQKQQQFLTKYVTNISDAATKLDEANKLLGKGLENFNSVLQNANSEQLLKDLQAALQVKLNSLAPSDPQIADLRAKLQKVDDLLKQYQVKAAKTGGSDPSIALLASQKNILNQIDALNQKQVSKSKTADEQAQDAIIASYTRMYQEIQAQNVKYQEYLKTHSVAEATKKGLQVIDPSQLNAQEIAALQTLAGTQSVEATKIATDQQKAIFKEYEEFKLQAGTDAANKLFGNELKGYKNYIDYLTSLQPKESDLTSADPFTKARASALQDYLSKALPAAQIQEFEEQQKHLQQLIIQDQDYQERRQTIIEKANEDIEQLNAAGFKVQADQAQRNRDDQISALDQQHFAQLDTYKALFDNIDTLSTNEAKKLLAQLYTYAAVALSTGKITVEAYAKIIKGLDNANNTINNKLPTGLKNIGGELQNIGSELTGVDEQFGKILQSVGKIVSGVGDFKAGLNNFNIASKAGDTFGQISSGLGLLGTGIGIVTTIIGTFNNSKEKAEQLQTQQDLEVKTIQAVNTELQRQLELTKQIYGPERISAYLAQLAQVKVDTENVQAQINTQLINGQTDVGLKAAITAFNNGTANSFQKKQVQQLTDVYKSLGENISLSGRSIDELQQLLDKGDLDTKTQALVQSLIDLQQQAIDTQNALQGDLLGTSFDTLIQNIDDLFTNATTSAADFAANFQKIIQQALLNAFNRQFLEKQLQGFYDDFFKLTQNAPNNVLSKDDIAKLKAEYDAIVNNASAQFKNIQDATGVIFGQSGSAATNTLAGQIQQNITEDTATILAGTLNGIQLGVYNTNQNLGRMIQIAQDALEAALSIQINTKRTADNSDALPDMLTQLKAINASSTGTYNNELRAAGLN